MPYKENYVVVDNLQEPINWKSPKAIVSYSIFLALLLWIGYTLGMRYDLNRNYRITIAETSGKRPTHKGVRIDFKFKVGSTEFIGSKDPTTEGPEKVVGGRYFIKYLPSDPQVNDLLWNSPVPSHILEAPVDGWDEIPN